MKINKGNYELFFVDYFDGNLSEELTRALFAFLQKHPDLKAEFESFEPVVLPPENITYPGKASLKKQQVVPTGSINEENYERFLIAYTENDLTKQDELLLQQFLEKNPSLREEPEKYAKLKLHPDKDIIFENKEGLKKQRALVPLKRPVFWYAAASVLLLFSLFYFNRPSGREELMLIDSLAAFDARLPNVEPPYNPPAPRKAMRPAFDQQPVQYRSAAPLNTLTAFENPGMLPEIVATKAPVKRMGMTTLFLYDMLEEDLEYYAMLQEYNSKNLFERLAYQAGNRLFNTNEMYVTDPGLPELNFSRESLSAINDFSFSDIFGERKPEGKAQSKEHYFKSGLIEIVHDKGE